MISSLTGRSFVSVTDFSSDEILAVLDLAADLKKETAAGKAHPRLAGKTLAMIFL